MRDLLTQRLPLELLEEVASQLTFGDFMRTGRALPGWQSVFQIDNVKQLCKANIKASNYRNIMSKTNKVSLSHVLCYATYHEENSMARELVGHGASFRLVSHGTLLMKKFESRPFNEVSFILSHGASLQAIPGDLRAFLEGLLWHLGGTESLGEFRWLKRVRLVLSNIPFYQESGVINEIFEAWLRKGGNCEATKILQEYGASFDFLPGGIGGVLERWFREDGASYAVKDLLEYQGASFSWVPGGFENLFAETVIKCARSLRQYENFPELSDEKLVARALSGDLVILGDPGYTSWVCKDMLFLQMHKPSNTSTD